MLAAVSDNSVWAEGLLVFYEIFRFIEEAILRLKNTPVGEFNFKEMMRTEAFEKDLEFYLDKNWAYNYTPRESVVKYLLHLQELEKENPILLMAYIYHLYMGLLSGGQILSKKRLLTNKFLLLPKEDREGNAVTDFGNHSIASIKKKIVETTNSIANDLDDNTKELLLKESKTVFVLNNAMIRTIRGTNIVIFKKICWLLIILSLILSVYLLWIKK